MDFNNLQSQNTKSIHNLYCDDIISLYDYHPWHNRENPNIDKITNTLINFKKNNKSRLPAVNFFTKVLNSTIKPKLGSERRVFCIVPSHTANTVSKALQETISNISESFSFENTETFLTRHTTVEKASTGGDRSIAHHLDSINITVPVPPDTTIFLFDDITTTGNSLFACEKILLENGADKVVKIAFGKTA